MTDRLDALLFRMQGLDGGKPLYPWPEADQDTAYVAFILHRQGQRINAMVDRERELRMLILNAYKAIVDHHIWDAVPSLEELEMWDETP